MSDDELDQLWQVHPDEFVRRRDALAKALRADGQAEDADAVKALKRPSPALWAVNRLAAERPALVDDLIDLGRRSERAMEQALRGEGASAMRDIDRERRRAVADATAAAAEVAAGAGHALSPAMTARVQSTIDAAVLQEETRDLLRAGRLPTELDAPGFAGLASLDVGADTAGTHRRHQADEQRRAEERTAAELRKAEAEADRLEAVAADAEAMATVARARADDARRRADALRKGS